MKAPLSSILKMYLTGPLVVDGDTSSNCSFLDGVAVKGCGIAQVLERGVKILILTALRVTTHIDTKLVGEIGDAVECGLRQVHTLIIHLAHGGELFHHL